MPSSRHAPGVCCLLPSHILGCPLPTERFHTPRCARKGDSVEWKRRTPEMSTTTTYQWLEPKPYKKLTKQLGIKGRNMTVWNLVADVVVSGLTPEEVAKDYRLPVEAVQEALEYYYANQEWIDAEVDEVGRRLGLK